MARVKKPAPPNMVVPYLIDRGIAQMEAPADLRSLSSLLGYAYQNLWAVYRGKRPMPALRLHRLCRFLGMSTDEAVRALENQERDWQAVKSARKSARAAAATDIKSK